MRFLPDRIGHMRLLPSRPGHGDESLLLRLFVGTAVIAFVAGAGALVVWGIVSIAQDAGWWTLVLPLLIAVALSICWWVGTTVTRLDV